ncbi:uncharacterized protein LOC110855595 [Folsomia candida]|uniref:uncharacterized protein LOC110855595 n=1 Tax=Folsomia candida TaxID=158441 RepID=UPI000B909221|nr:uncharacterized protein LOC110855595 [Folsomia candida]
MSRRKQTFVVRDDASQSQNDMGAPSPKRSKDAARKRLERENESEEQTAARHLTNSRSYAKSRENETVPETLARLERRRTNRINAADRRIQATCRMALINEIDESQFPLHNIGQFDVICNDCNAIHFENERAGDGKFTVCCNKGKVKLPEIQTNDYIKGLLTGTDPDSKHFFDNIRSYNSAFGFASVGAQIRAPPGFGPYCFRIHGQIYHRTGRLHPEGSEPRKYAQIYILDQEQATAQRMNQPANASCKERIMTKLFDIMQHNDLAKAYKMLYEVEQEEKDKAAREGRVENQISMAILQNRNSDPRRYNVQRSNEVAVIFSNTDGEPPLERDLLVHLRSRGQNVHGTKRISILHKNLDSMTYPIFYPNAEQGWGEDLTLINTGNTRRNKARVADELAADLAIFNPAEAPVATNKRKRVTLKMYYSYLFSIRNQFSPILSGGKLTQQYFVDAYVKAEANDLNYIRHHQGDLRADSYSSLIDHVSEAHDAIPGKRIILPSTFEGSPRNMNQKYQDAMTIVRKFGKPEDLFVTMTCNPKWDEIVQNLRTGERAENRPDLVARVFKLKLKELLDDLIEKQVFGTVLAKVHVIEFQKRGLPHAHILIILKLEDKPRTATLIDKIVKAEIPNKDTHPRLFEVVTKNMIHGPCNKPGSRSPCLITRLKPKCCKGFPKPFQSETQNNVNGYPAYQRQNLGTVVLDNQTEINNSWVVPYNPYLSLKYNCHVNVEVCASIKSVKYLFKYAYKGHDCANAQISIDEVQTHVDSRYVSPPEAA